MKRIFINSALLILWMTALLGIAYPLAVWGTGQLLFRDAAGGSLVVRDGRVAGSRLIAQQFVSPGYLHPRPSAAAYRGDMSGGSTFAQSNAMLLKAAEKNMQRELAENPAPVPPEMVFASGSGLDPHISPSCAVWQAPRIAKARGVDEAVVSAIIDKAVEKPFLGLFGESRVNVLEVNMKLDAELSARGK